MAFRPGITTSVAALVGAGAIVAATPVIAPPLTPRDLQVAADVQTELTAAQTDLLRSARSARSVSAPSEDFARALRTVSILAGANGASSVAGAVVTPMALPPDVTLPPTSLQQLVDYFFDGGFTLVIGSLVNGVTIAIFGLNSLPTAISDTFFFGGYPEEDSPGGFVGVARLLIDTFLSGGFPPTALAAAASPGVTPTALPPDIIGVPPTSLQDVVDDFFDGGITQVVGSLVNGVTIAIFGLNSLPTAISDTFFFGGYPEEDSPGGFVGVARLLIDTFLSGGFPPTALAAAASPGVTPTALPPDIIGVPPTSLQDVVDDFFDGGITQVVGSLVNGVTIAIFGLNSLPTAISDTFFFGGYPEEDSPGGFVGVARLLIDTFLSGGFPPTALAAAASPGVTPTALPPDIIGVPPTSLQDVVDDFFDGGITQVVGSLVNGVTIAIFGLNSLPTAISDTFFFGGYPEEDSPGGFVGVARLLIDTFLSGGFPPTTMDSTLEPEPRRLAASGLFGANQTDNPAAGSFQLPTPKNLVERFVPRPSSPAEKTGTEAATELPTPAGQEEQAPSTFGARVQEGIADFREAVADQREKIRESLNFSPKNSDDTDLTGGGTSGSEEAKPGWKPGDGLKKLRDRFGNGGKSNDGQTEGSEQGSDDGE
ncbi:hypothetical protein ACRCUN_29475 [Mycobacterium sp. LTG2003]